MNRYKKTNKEINRRIYEIFENSNPESVGLTQTESARVQELLWVMGTKPTAKAERLMNPKLKGVEKEYETSKNNI